MRYIGIRDLKSQASEVLRQVRETGAEYLVTVHGKPVARLMPLSARGRSNRDLSQLDELWVEMDDLARDVASKAPPDLALEEVLQDMRRELG